MVDSSGLSRKTTRSAVTSRLAAGLPSFVVYRFTRRLLQSELLSVGANAQAIQNMLAAFDRSRLLSFDRDPVTCGPTVEVAHEAILREWRQLRTWLDESRDDIRLQRMLAVAAAEWQQANCDTSYLLTGSRLAQFEGWAETAKIALTQEERHYLDASIAESRRRIAARRHLRNLALATVTVIAILMTVLTVIALQERDNAERSANKSLSLALASGAREAVSKNDPDLGLALAVEANGVPQALPQAQDTLAEIALAPGTRRIFAGHTSPVMAVAVSPDGSTMLTGSGQIMLFLPKAGNEDYSVRLWDLQTGAEIRLCWPKSSSDCYFAGQGYARMRSFELYSAKGQLCCSANASNPISQG